MHLLQYLANPRSAGIEVEFRLLCSGELYREHFGDWRKSTGARILFQEPFQVIVASQPYDEYPQEIALRFSTDYVTETAIPKDGGKATSNSYTFLPDNEIAADITALLTLSCRRFISVAMKVRERHSDSSIHAMLRDFPMPCAARNAIHFWKPRPGAIISGRDGVTFKDHQPAPRAVDVAAVTTFLSVLPKLAAAEALVRCARRYALAMELIDTRFEIAYQHLISAVETIAGEVFPDFSPGVDEIVASKAGLVQAAKREGLSDESAKRLAIEAARDNPWSRRKFKQFLIDYVDDTVFDPNDDLFLVPDVLMPKKDDFNKVLNLVYDLRSGASHSGKVFPVEASIGTSPLLPVAAMHNFMSGELSVPPIGWFERVVNNAVLNFIRSSLSSRDLGAGEQDKGSGE